ncbi:MAG TPA: hypothetical protein VEC93_01580 [Anaerolineae bacterium]|nr:hypothetical protein [Anaerolineae bacterium]
MADMMNLEEASEYLKLSKDNVILLAEARELEGQPEDGDWRLTRASVVAYKARQLAQENATQGVEDPDR